MNDRVVMLTGLKTTPEVFVERLRQHAGKIKHIACVIQWSETDSGNPSNETGVYSTSMPIGDAAWLAWVFAKDFPGTDEPPPMRDPGRP